MYYGPLVGEANRSSRGRESVRHCSLMLKQSCATLEREGDQKFLETVR